MRNLPAIRHLRSFNRFYTNILGVVDRHILDHPYSLTEVRVLFEIFHDPNCTARKIKKTLRVDEGYLSRTIDRLVKQDLVTKKRSPRDGRAWLLSLSRKGRREFKNLNREADRSVASMIESLSSGEVQEVVSLTHRVQELLSPGPPPGNLGLEDVNIRTTLQPGDLGAVVRLHGLLYGAEYAYGIAFETYVARGVHEFYASYDPKQDGVWVCEHQGRMVGFLLLMHRDDRAAQLRYFLVRPEYRGLGLGKRLMDLFVEFLHRHGYRSAYLWTTHELSAAASLYTRHGFRLTEEKESSAFGKALREQRYDLQLSA